MAQIQINPNQATDIYNNGNILIPSYQPHLGIKNVGLAPVKVSSHWAPPFGDYTQYSVIEVPPGEVGILLPPPNLIYFFKVTATNLSGFLTAKIEMEVGTHNTPPWK
ncbi:hypothetical protein Ppb6_02079 [Photorhabdus australis subsp. thailandensis]|uniref:Fibronectin type-III domain-containing protein n=1 Tax=Photorhabdus australis subsp. thailandensis TaxID=2805096 RepID=A0A1C0U4C0_9GAMM|nr:hypothetical protein [Photorhabdus australis]OCQ52735.1 hypothetical protein Ppb6_02079 [Photorhabdus australis subsp. thailandensis]